MAPHQLSIVDARRIAVRAQLLTSIRPAGLDHVVRHLTLLQLDPTSAIAPNADLVAWSRLGSAYSRADLVAALDRRDLIELNALIRPREDLALFRGAMAERRLVPSDWIQANDAARRDVLALLASSGPLPSRDIPDTCALPWASTGWTNNQNVVRLLDAMANRDEVAIAGRKGRERLWDLASRVYPDDPIVPAERALRERDVRRLHALGIARAKGPAHPMEPVDVGDAGEAAVVDGVKGLWRVEPSLLGQPFEGRAALLSPFDRLIHDRRRTIDLFGFDYQLEMYKPAAQRRWGYFALPILFHDQLVGKLDATADRKARVLRVDAIHQDVAFTKTTTAAVRREIEDLAQWLQLDLLISG